jgi:hypothetical protein
MQLIRKTRRMLLIAATKDGAQANNTPGLDEIRPESGKPYAVSGFARTSLTR